MSRVVPIGHREHQRLEFKARAALAKPETVARAIVSMLNAEGGAVWVGVRDEGDVAVALEGIDDAESVRSRLFDSLLDRIEPSPQAGELRIEVVHGEVDLLKVEATPVADRRPYALITGQGRQYPVRVGARVRSLTREEIGTLFARAAASPAAAASGTTAAAERLLAEQQRILAAAASVLWIGVVPAAGDAELNFNAVRESDLFVDPNRTEGYRLYGWPAAFLGARWTGKLEIRTRNVAGSTRLVWSTPQGDELSLDRGGSLFARASLQQFATGKLPYVGGDEPVLFPDRFLGWVVSAFRVLSELYSDDRCWVIPLPNLDASACVSLAVTGLAGWRLLPGLLPRSAFVPPRYGDLARPAESDFFLAAPLPLTQEAIRNEPDRCAFRLVARFYEAFGFSESDIPLYDTRSGRFVWDLAQER